MRIRFLIILIVLFSSCSKEVKQQLQESEHKATVTFMVSINGLGDNGYNDDAAKGIFGFAQQTGTRLSLLLPDDMAEAEQMYHQWLEDNAKKDSAVLILGSSAYEQMAQRASASDKDKLRSLKKRGGRILLFESNAQIDGVSTVMVSHYGVSWLAGAMSQGFDALILAAATGIPALEESIAGFREARKTYAGQFYGHKCLTTLHYLSDNEAGFAMPDSAYRYIAERADTSAYYDEMIFPLLGGSEAGVVRRLNDDMYTMALMIGMDVDQTGQSTRIPFSVVINIGNVINRYLNDWRAGIVWPEKQRLGMNDDAADIVITPNFTDHLYLWDERYGEPDTFLKLYRQYRDEAARKDCEYEN
ncbi:MAG: hypothetical protein J6V95_01610 [Bacteroidaceae bacterium]|nr:hypothetical protein [Bacteroidaceae bacterium]